MEEAHVTITIKPIHMERLAYWIVIIGLAVLLILAFMKDDSCDPATAGADTDEQAAAPAAATDTPAAPAPAAASASCVDDLKNQDETDVDCGGAKCPKCIAGKACVAAGDCVSGYCTANVCTATAPTQLSGKATIDVTKAYTTKSPSGTAKVTGIDYKVANGMEEELDGYVIKVFVKNKAGTRCLNQEVLGTCDQQYVEFSSARTVASGKDSGTQTQMFADLNSPRMGWYLIEDNGYDPADSSLDDIQIIAYLYDANGNQIDDKIISDTIAVSP